MKAAFLSLLLFGILTAAAETPQEVCKRVITSESSMAYNPLNSTEDELNRASAFNSQLQLTHIMLSDTVSEELRVCYALHVIKGQRGFVRLAGAGLPRTATELKLDSDTNILAAYLRHLNDSRK